MCASSSGLPGNRSSTHAAIRVAWVWVALAVGLTSGSAEAASPSLNFDQVFVSRGQPRTIHFTATYITRSGEHHLELWRDGDRRVRRHTDESADSYVTHIGTDEDWQMVILDHRRKLSSTIDRQSLLKLGTVTDWFDLAHGLNRPFGTHQVARASAPPKLVDQPVGVCEWYSLSQNGRISLICWSQGLRIPLLIAGSEDSRAVWRIDKVDTRRIDPSVFQVSARGYMKNDASKDILDD